MAAARFVKGQYRTRKHTAASNLTAGDVVYIGNSSGLANGIAHQDITNAAVGTLAIGGGIYEVINLNNAANGAAVYWDGTKVTSVSTNMSKFGYITENGGGGANTLCYALHHPFY